MVIKKTKTSADVRYITVLRHILFGRGYMHITPDEVAKKVDLGENNYVILDVRKSGKGTAVCPCEWIMNDDYDAGHIKGAISAPIKLLNKLIDSHFLENNREKDVIVTCYRGGLSRAASAMLAEYGFSKVYNMDGGMAKWRAELEK